MYVLVWKEVEIAGLYNLSSHTKEVLERHDNIKVFRHPTSLISFWSHHEKICVIDQSRGFVGGIDMCMGRYDLNSHPIKDLPDESGKVIFPGKDYSNSRIKDFLNVNEWKTELIERAETPRMPWHDIHVFVDGESAQDLAIHFIEYWNHAKYENEGWEDIHSTFLKPISKLTHTMNTQKGRHLDGCINDLHRFDKDEEYGIIGKEFIEYLVYSDEEEVEVDKGVKSLNKKELLKQINHHSDEYNDSMNERDEIEKEVKPRVMTATWKKDRIKNMFGFNFNKNEKKDRDLFEAIKDQKEDEEYYGDADLVAKMNEFVEKEYNKSFGRVGAKKFMKKMYGGEVDETEEKRIIMERYVKSLTKQQRKELKRQYRAAKKKKHEHHHKNVTGSLNIASQFLTKKKGT